MRDVVCIGCLVTAVITSGVPSDASVATDWNEQLLSAIRIDTPRPTVHSRNLFHSSAAMYDAWAAYDSTSVGYLYKQRESAADVESARNEAISHAAYSLLKHRFTNSPGAATSLTRFRNQMISLGYDPDMTATTGSAPAAVGNRIAQAYISRGLADGSNEQANYADTTGYQPSNPALVVSSTSMTVNDPNRWSPLTIGANTQRFLTPQWGGVSPFAVTRAPGTAYGSALVSPPPAFGTPAFNAAALDVIRFSSHLDPNDGAMIDISPAARGNNPLGTNAGAGYSMNPVTNAPYTSEFVKRGDYGRVLAEFWADGPNSETPPGHWNTIANQVSADPRLQRRLGGSGSTLGELEWDVKLHFALNAAVYDAAIVAWDNKRQSDYVRPIGMIRYAGQLGQSSDASMPRYHPLGLPLEAGLVELVTPESAAPGGRHAGLSVGEVAIFCWKGTDAIDTATGVAGCGWIEARTWDPYQASTFVTPAFPGYTSGHSTFSRAAAEVLAAFTGSEFFPGGLGEFSFNANQFLHFETGPSTAMQLEWATYFDAADEAGLSRLYGGIHVAADDLNGRITGSWAGTEAFNLSLQYFNGTVPEPASAAVVLTLATIAFRRPTRTSGVPRRSRW